MQIDPALLVTSGVLLAGLATTWGALGIRVRNLEKDSATKAELAALEKKWDEARTAQGVRIGKIETKTDGLAGQFNGFQSGFATGRRSRTAAHGNPTPASPEGEG